MIMMDKALKDKFFSLWKKYFSQSELPIVLYYTEEKTVMDFVRNYKKYETEPVTVKENPSEVIVNYLEGL